MGAFPKFGVFWNGATDGIGEFGASGARGRQRQGVLPCRYMNAQ